MQEFIDDRDLAWLGRLAGALLGESHAADLVQDTVAATIERPMPSGVPRRAWMATIARRLAARRFRGESRRRERERMSARHEARADDSELLERAEAIERVTAAARSLPEPFRRTILLRFLADLDPGEIAEREGQRVDTVRWRVRRGLELLRRELGEGGVDWRPAALLLLPLTPAAAGSNLAATGASSSSVGSVLVGVTSMKSVIALTTVIVCLGLWLFDDRNDASPRPRQETASVDESPSISPRRTTERPVESSSPSATPDAATEDAPIPESDRDVGGRFVDAMGLGVADAIVFTVEGDAASQSKVVTDEGGRFALADDSPVDLGVTANGFLRAFVKGFDPTSNESIVLERGASLAGRVVDASGQPVADLELLAHTPGTRIDHVSPSQMRRRAERAALKGESSPYEGSRDRTDSSGIVELRGLPEGEVRICCLDPSWRLEGPVRCTAGGPFVEWTATRRVGVHVEVTAPAGAPRIESVRAVFKVELELANGETEDYEQWIGRGDGEASFGLDETILPRLSEVKPRRITFQGTVTSGEMSAEWRAEPLEMGSGRPRIARVKVTLGESRATEVEPEADEEPVPEPVVEMTTLRLDVRHESGAPVRDRLVVRWSGDDFADGVARIEADTPGYYELRVPAAELDLVVKKFSWSGSLPPWTDRVRLAAGSTRTLRVELAEGGTVIIERPRDFDGAWTVHASWRPVGESEWRGSWNYGTTEGSLELSALRAAEWRFRARRDDDEEDVRTRTVTVKVGETRVITP